ncbi:hypothetical protein PANPA_00066 (plasmid) [Pantoea sp. Nvir]|uniref:MarR family winged helix-turn-helix transcriptional regulator n=1 Tax=Pantoea sp. Nvir TaxID=2576760 RepID=UPI0030CD249B
MENDKCFTSSELTALREGVMALSRRLKKEIQNNEWTMAQILLLGAIERKRKDVTPSYLAETEGMASSNVAATLKILEKHQLITRQKSSTDKRLSYIFLTQAGQDVLNRNRKKRECWLSEAISHTLTIEEIRALILVSESLSRIAEYKA